MRILAVLENDQAIPAVAQMVAKFEPDAELLCFGNALNALAAARKQEIEHELTAFQTALSLYSV